jgi:dihydroneopterin aldolase
MSDTMPRPARSPSVLGTETNSTPRRRILVRDLVLEGSIGVHAHEHAAHQRIRINLDLEMAEPTRPIADDLAEVPCYDEIIGAVRRIVQAGHIRLVETLADRIAELCLADPRIRMARVGVEKLDVYDDVGSVGVIVERTNDVRESP